MCLVAVLTVAGCGSASRPTPEELAGPDAKPLTQTNLQAGVAVLALRPTGEPAITAWTEGGSRETFVGKGAPSSPVVGWVKGEALVGGYTADPKAERAELITEERKAYQGKLTKGAYLFAWPAAEAPKRFVLRVLDKQGNELYRWPPVALPAA